MAKSRTKTRATLILTAWVSVKNRRVFSEVSFISNRRRSNCYVESWYFLKCAFSEFPPKNGVSMMTGLWCILGLWYFTGSHSGLNYRHKRVLLLRSSTVCYTTIIIRVWENLRFVVSQLFLVSSDPNVISCSMLCFSCWYNCVVRLKKINDAFIAPWWWPVVTVSGRLIMWWGLDPTSKQTQGALWQSSSKRWSHGNFMLVLVFMGLHTGPLLYFSLILKYLLFI